MRTFSPAFTTDYYQACLEYALTNGYSVIPFCDFASTQSRPVLILRHDLDHVLEPALEVAELEATLGIRATYFIQTACAFYNLLSPRGREIVKKIRGLGHEIGLHYESHRYVGEVGREVLAADLRLLEDLSGQKIISAAQHIPIDGDFISLAPDIQNEAYEPRFMNAPMAYISDSLMSWRQARPHELLEQGKSFQFLTHPENWTESSADIPTLLQRLQEQEIGDIQDLYSETGAYYQSLLADRSAKDRAFRERRSARG